MLISISILYQRWIEILNGLHRERKDYHTELMDFLCACGWEGQSSNRVTLQVPENGSSWPMAPVTHNDCFVAYLNQKYMLMRFYSIQENTNSVLLWVLYEEIIGFSIETKALSDSTKIRSMTFRKAIIMGIKSDVLNQHPIIV